MLGLNPVAGWAAAEVKGGGWEHLTDVARRMDIHDTVGQDLVAMVVDDLVVCGAEPLYVTDYIAVGKDSYDLADGIGLTNIGKELITQTRAFRGAFNDSCDIYERYCGRKNFLGVENLRQFS